VTPEEQKRFAENVARVITDGDVRAPSAIAKILTAKLASLFELVKAGQAMRERYAPFWDRCPDPDCSTCAVPKAWDAALAKWQGEGK